MLLLESDSCKLARQTRIICSIRKSDILCFQVLLSFVSTISVIARSPLHSPPGRFRPEPSLRTEASAKTCEVSENSNSMRDGQISALNCGSFWVRFSFVLDLPSFVFKDILASVVVFLFLLIPASRGSPGRSRFSLLVPGIPALPLRQNVTRSTTEIGYHKPARLSSEKCTTSEGDVNLSVRKQGECKLAGWQTPTFRV